MHGVFFVVASHWLQEQQEYPSTQQLPQILEWLELCMSLVEVVPVGK